MSVKQRLKLSSITHGPSSKLQSGHQANHRRPNRRHWTKTKNAYKHRVNSSNNSNQRRLTSHHADRSAGWSVGRCGLLHMTTYLPRGVQWTTMSTADSTHPSPPRRAPRRMRAGESLRLGRCALLGFTLVLSMSDRDGRFYGHISAGNHHHRKPAVNRTWRVDPLANPRNWTQSTGEWLYIWFCGEEEACVC